MSVLTPPPQDELEALIPEARARQRRRRLGLAALVAVLAGTALGISSILGGAGRHATTGAGGGALATNHESCGIRVQGVQVFQGGQLVYREPGDWTHAGSVPSEVRCSGATVWIVWIAGAAMSQEAYVGARSADGGRTWRLVFSEAYFGVKAPHELDSYFGPWTLRGPREAYFVGTCPACGGAGIFQTVSLYVTKDGGHSFRTYRIPGLTGFEPTRLRLSGDRVVIAAKRFARGVAPRKTVTLPVS